MSDILVQLSITHGQSVQPLQQGEGLLRTFTGSQVEDPTQEYHITVWSPDATPPAQGPSQGSTYNIPFKDAPSNLFEGPVTEICIARLKGPEHKSILEDNVLPNMHKGLSTQSVVNAAAWSISRDDPSIYCLLIDWSSLDAHLAMANSEQGKQGTAYIKTLLDLDQKHVSLRKL